MIDVVDRTAHDVLIDPTSRIGAGGHLTDGHWLAFSSSRTRMGCAATSWHAARESEWVPILTIAMARLSAPVGGRRMAGCSICSSNATGFATCTRNKSMWGVERLLASPSSCSTCTIHDGAGDRRLPGTRSHAMPSCSTR